MDPQAFIAADDEEGDLPYDVRFAGMDLIGVGVSIYSTCLELMWQSLIDMYPQPVAAQLQFALENTVQLSLSMTISGGADWYVLLRGVSKMLDADFQVATSGSCPHPVMRPRRRYQIDPAR